MHIIAKLMKAKRAFEETYPTAYIEMIVVAKSATTKPTLFDNF